jgi:hypothetical protein
MQERGPSSAARPPKNSTGISTEKADRTGPEADAFGAKACVSAAKALASSPKADAFGLEASNHGAEVHAFARKAFNSGAKAHAFAAKAFNFKEKACAFSFLSCAKTRQFGSFPSGVSVGYGSLEIFSALHPQGFPEFSTAAAKTWNYPRPVAMARR